MSQWITKQEHHYTSEEKLKFCGYGEWVEEADITEIEYLGYEVRVVRIFMEEPFAKVKAYFGGHLCGYVKIPQSHPYFGKKDIYLDCHGGLTFNEAHEEHWAGFDCGHSGDYIPSTEHMRNTMPELIELKKKFPIPKGMEHHPLFKPVYRNVDYCIQQCISMIDQLINVSVTTTQEECK